MFVIFPGTDSMKYWSCQRFNLFWCSFSFEVEVKHAVSWDERSHRVHEHPTIQNRTEPGSGNPRTESGECLGDLLLVILGELDNEMKIMVRKSEKKQKNPDDFGWWTYFSNKLQVANQQWMFRLLTSHIKLIPSVLVDQQSRPRRWKMLKMPSAEPQDGRWWLKPDKLGFLVQLGFVQKVPQVHWSSHMIHVWIIYHIWLLFMVFM